HVIPRAAQDIDVLFYGSLNERRAAVLRELARHANVRARFGIYGAERDQLIARAKVVLNLHFYEAQLMEQVRIAYLLNNGCFVLSEDAPDNPYGSAIATAPYGELAAACLRYLADPDERQRQATSSLEWFQRGQRGSADMRPPIRRT